MNPKPNVAVLVDCENAQPAVIDHAMQLASTLGYVALRRGYGNQSSLTINWQEALIRHGFSPCMQFQYVTKKNTADIALALDALEMLLDRRAEKFLIVTSDSDFVGLCHKLRERGAEVQVLGESKTPAALRHACNKFHEAVSPALQPAAVKTAADKPKFVVKAVREMVSDSSSGMVDLGQLLTRLKQVDADFSPKAYGYTKLRKMLEAYDQLKVHQSPGGHCRVGLAQPAILRAA